METSTSVREAMLGFYDRFSSGDAASLADALTADEDAPLVIGTAPEQWEAGRSTWIAAFESQASQMPGLRLEGDDPRCHEEGTVGWGADRPSIVLPDGARIPVRVTTVFRREGDAWKLVTAHFSLAVPDEKLPELLAWGAAAA